MNKLCIPEKILEQHVAILGKTGAGKSSALRHIVEHLLSQKKRVCVVDPKGDWWGLKSDADGKSAGFPVIAFGDFKEPKAQDVPINAQSGKHVAELITSGNRPCIIGFRGWMTSHMIKFWIDFASTIFNANSGELYLVGDEFHNFAPKGKILDPEAGKCLHWSNRLMSEGRGYGLVCLIASQRPQKVHNDTLTCCETLVAMRVIHAADRGAVKDWIDGCGDIAQGKEVLDNLAGMSRGEAYVWSPEVGFGPKRLTFPMFKTFDSFAPPQLQKKISTASWTDVNLDEVKQKMATVIEEAKANDPTELKKKILELQRELKKAQNPITGTSPEPIIKEIPRFTVEDEKMLRRVHDRIAEVKELLARGHIFFPKIEEELAKISKVPEVPKMPLHYVPNKLMVHAPPKGSVSQRRNPNSFSTNGDIGRCERAILTALAQYPQGRSPVQAAILSGYSSGSGGFNNSLSRLRSMEYITRGNPMQITDSGISALGEWNPLPAGKELAEYWIKKLGRCSSQILSALVECYPNGLTPEELGDKAGYVPSSGGFNNSLSELRTLELITRGRPIKASEDFFQ